MGVLGAIRDVKHRLIINIDCTASSGESTSKGSAKETSIFSNQSEESS